MEDIESRLKEASDSCIKAFESWGKAKKNPELREALQENLHELRKVTARLEIEVAISEREDMTQRPINIPPHRSSRRQGNDLPGFINNGMDDDNTGNVSDEQPNFNTDRPQQPTRQHANNQGRGGFQRRPMRRPQGGGGNGGGGSSPSSDD